MQTAHKSSANRAVIATLSPKAYLVNPTFWLYEQRAVLVALGFGIVTTLLMAPLIWSPSWTVLARTANFINVGIYAIGLFGCISALKSIAKVRIESALASQILEGISRPRPMTVELTKLPDAFLPRNATKPPLAMPRLFHHICLEAQNLRFGDSSELVQPYIDESVDSVFELVNLQKLALRGGICATFVGLLLALQQMSSGAGGGRVSEGQLLGDLVRQLSTSLFIAFSGSAVGLQVALLLGFLVAILRAQQVELFRTMVETTTAIVSVARGARNDAQSEVINELGLVQREIKDLGRRLHDHASSIERNLTATQGRIDAQTNAVTEGLDKLNAARLSYQNLLNGVAAVQNGFIAEVQKIYDDLRLDNVRSDIKGGLIEAGSKIADTLRSTESAIAAQTSEMQNTVDAFSTTGQSYAKFLQQIESSHQQFLNNVRNAHDTDPLIESNIALQRSIEQLRAQVSSLGQTVRQLNSGSNGSFWSRVFRRS